MLLESEEPGFSGGLTVRARSHDLTKDAVAETHGGGSRSGNDSGHQNVIQHENHDK